MRTIFLSAALVLVSVVLTSEAQARDFTCDYGNVCSRMRAVYNTVDVECRGDCRFVFHDAMGEMDRLLHIIAGVNGGDTADFAVGEIAFYLAQKLCATSGQGEQELIFRYLAKANRVITNLYWLQELADLRDRDGNPVRSYCSKSSD